MAWHCMIWQRILIVVMPLRLLSGNIETNVQNISKQAAKNRRLLVDAMAQAGFSNYRREWWHFRFEKEPYRRKYFDFPVTSPKSMK